MRRAKGLGLAWIVLVGCAAALALWPDARKMAVLQARLVAGLIPEHSGYASPWSWHRHDPLKFVFFEPWVDGADEVRGDEALYNSFLWLANQSREPDTCALVAAGACSPRPWEGRSAENPAFAALVEAAPDEPLTWALLVYGNLPRIPRQGEPAVQPSPPRGPDSARRRQLTEAIARGRDLDPDTALWDLAEVRQYVAAGALEQAEATILVASTRHRFHDYRSELHAAVYEADLRLAGNAYRSSQFAGAAISALTRCGDAPWIATPEVFRQAARHEGEGQPGRALKVYEAAFGLDVLRDLEPPSDPLNLTRASTAKRAWLERHDVLAEEPEALRDGEDRYDAWQAHQARTLASFQAFVRSQGRPDLAAKAQATEDRWTVGWRPERARISQISELIWLAPDIWRLQMIALMLVPLLALMAVALRLIARRLRDAPASLWPRTASALGVAAIAFILCQVSVAITGSHLARWLTLLHPFGPSHAVDHPLSLPPLAALVASMGAAFLMVTWQRRISKAGVEHIARPSLAAATLTEWLMALATIAYLSLTAWQVAFQSAMVAILP